MQRQPKNRINQLIAQFPILGLIRMEYRWKRKRGSKKMVDPVMDIRVQVADPEAMLLQAKNIYLHTRGGYLRGENDERGTRCEYLVAVSHDGEEVARLDWPLNVIGLYAQDIFLEVEPSQVDYLVWVSSIDWYEPVSEQFALQRDFDYGKQLRSEVFATIYQKPKTGSFAEIIETAEQQLQERQKGSQYFPEKNSWP